MPDVVKQLAEIRLHNADARKVFDALLEYQHSRKEVTVDVLRQRTGLRPPAIRAVLSELQSLELGELVLGRRGKPTRFQWFERFHGVLPKRVPGEPKPGSTPDRRNARALTQWAYNLAPGRDVQLLVPANLNQTEAAKVLKFIERTLRAEGSPA